MSTNPYTFNQKLDIVLTEIGDVLIDKNTKYGNSALEPCRIFSKANSTEGIRVRIDDKLSRLVSGQSDDTEDTEMDLLGYLIML